MMYNEHRKGADRSKRFALVNSYLSKKQPLPLVGAVAFLMLFFNTNVSHHNINDSHNSVYYCHHDTNDT